MLKQDLIALFQYLIGDYRENSAELFSGRNWKAICAFGCKTRNSDWRKCHQETW